MLMLIVMAQAKQVQTGTTDTKSEETVNPVQKPPNYLSDPLAPLLEFSPELNLSLAQSFEGLAIFGGTGSGKTSGSISHIARAMLRAGFGGLVLCAKEDESDQWLRYAAETGRSDSVIRFAPDTPTGFNFIAYELARSGSPFEVVKVVENALKALDPYSETSGDGKLWEDAAKLLLVYAVVVLYSSTGSCDIATLKNFIHQAPLGEQNYDVALSDAIAKLKRGESVEDNVFIYHFFRAVKNDGKHFPVEDFNKAAAYFQYDFGRMPEKTRFSIVMNLMTVLNRFDYGVLNKKFTRSTNVVPELTHGGAILIIDLPAMHTDDNVIAGHIWKYAFQRSTTRQATDKTRPVFLFCDEAQYFLNSHDVKFQSTARSSRVSTIYATQSLDAYHDTLGGSARAKTATTAFLANFRTQIFHANNSESTNLYASTMIGKTLLWRRNSSRNKNMSESDTLTVSDGYSKAVSDSVSHAIGVMPSLFKERQHTQGVTDTQTGGTSEGKTKQFGEGITEGGSEQKDFRLDPDVFANELRSGSAKNDYKVDAVLVSPDIPLPYLPVTFLQK